MIWVGQNPRYRNIKKMRFYRKLALLKKSESFAQQFAMTLFYEKCYGKFLAGLFVDRDLIYILFLKPRWSYIGKGGSFMILKSFFISCPRYNTFKDWTFIENLLQKYRILIFLKTSLPVEIHGCCIKSFQSTMKNVSCHFY